MWESFKGAWGLIQGKFRADVQIKPHMGADCKKFAYGPGTIYAGVPSCLGFRIGGRLYSNFLASTLDFQSPKIPINEVLISRGPKDHINMRILQTMVCGIPPCIGC